MNKKFNAREAWAKIDANKTRLTEIADTCESENREMNDAEKNEVAQIRRENELLALRLSGQKNVSRETNEKSIAQSFREQVVEALNSRQAREITLADFGTEGSPNNANISVAAEAVNTTVKNVLPNLEKGLVFGQQGMNITYGADGNVVWPYATNNIEVAERTEKTAVTASDITFDNIKPDPYEASIIVKVTNEAIDNASFDLYNFVMQQIELATQRYLNKKCFGTVNFTGLKGPFANKKASTAVAATWKNIRKLQAGIAATGVSTERFGYITNAYTQALLETTPKADGQGGFIMEDGKIGGKPVFITEFIGIKADGSFDTEGYYLGCGAWQYLAAMQHGKVRLTVDPVTLADNNETKFVLHTKWSLTDLSAGKAFKVVGLSDPA